MWKIHYGELTLQLKTMGFKHTGVFPEQAVNWDFAMDKIRAAGRPVKVLNLFGYTGSGHAGLRRRGRLRLSCRREPRNGFLGQGERRGLLSGGQARALACG